MLDQDKKTIFKYSQDNAELYEKVMYYQQEMLWQISMGNTEGAVVSFHNLYKNSPPGENELATYFLQGMFTLAVILHRCYVMNLPVNRLSYILFQAFDYYLRIQSAEDYLEIGEWVLKEVCGLVNTKNGYSSPVRKACQYINENLSSWLKEKDIALAAGCSVSRLNNLFKEELGITPYKYMIRRKLKLSCFLMLESDLSVTQIAHMTGFCSSSHFDKVFRHHMKMLPTEYRKQGVIFGTNKMLPDW